MLRVVWPTECTAGVAPGGSAPAQGGAATLKPSVWLKLADEHWVHKLRVDEREPCKLGLVDVGDDQLIWRCELRLSAEKRERRREDEFISGITSDRPPRTAPGRSSQSTQPRADGLTLVWIEYRTSVPSGILCPQKQPLPRESFADPQRRLDLPVLEAFPVDAPEEGVFPDVPLTLCAAAQTLGRVFGHQLLTRAPWTSRLRGGATSELAECIQLPEYIRRLLTRKKKSFAAFCPFTRLSTAVRKHHAPLAIKETPPTH
ncbi:hypothetical protein EYF80_053238 [Liparis tanakae]|uniref:Uncharacterized protein n=1 Tax=Liparis tanakae TaxID=230148 RepID=A0A4Z2F5T0_9TELE|nr:hypothetical protein EYF80_053238 [Liparis tanakae]